jgi:hypothetical protein
MLELVKASFASVGHAPQPRPLKAGKTDMCVTVTHGEQNWTFFWAVSLSASSFHAPSKSVNCSQLLNFERNPNAEGDSSLGLLF